MYIRRPVPVHWPGTGHSRGRLRAGRRLHRGRPRRRRCLGRQPGQPRSGIAGAARGNCLAVRAGARASGTCTWRASPTSNIGRLPERTAAVRQGGMQCAWCWKTVVECLGARHKHVAVIDTNPAHTFAELRSSPECSHGRCSYSDVCLVLSIVRLQSFGAHGVLYCSAAALCFRVGCVRSPARVLFYFSNVFHVHALVHV